MNPLTIVNAAANVIVAAAVLDMAFRVFGRPEHPIHKSPWMLGSRKLVSSVVICGAVLNVATLSTPNWTEVILNVGFSLNYLWSSIYDRVAHTKHPPAPSTVSRKHTSGRASDSAKTESHATTSVRRRPGSTK
jgi:hypothetical protein